MPRPPLSAEHVLVPRRELVELYECALELRRLVDEAGRLRIDASALLSRLERLLPPGVALGVALRGAEETTPIDRG